MGSFLTSAHSYAATNNYCSKVPGVYGERLAKSFKQNPIEFLEQLLKASSKESLNSEKQNELISASFDLRKVYRANAKSFKSKIITNSLFDWVRTQYFGNLNNNYINKNKYLLNKNHDLLTESERLNMKSFKPQWTSIEKVRCTKKETALLGCYKSMFKVTLQFLPEVSCKKRDLKKAFEADFYLTYHSKYGFKVLDLNLSGKRLVMDSVEMMLSLKKDGFNKNAIARHLGVLSVGSKSFKIPRKQVHSGRFLATFGKEVSEERQPASL
jgi:hypothetical protein